MTWVLVRPCRRCALPAITEPSGHCLSLLRHLFVLPGERYGCLVPTVERCTERQNWSELNCWLICVDCTKRTNWQSVNFISVYVTKRTEWVQFVSVAFYMSQQLPKTQRYALWTEPPRIRELGQKLKHYSLNLSRVILQVAHRLLKYFLWIRVCFCW